ncbi:MAG: DoxX family protein [Saprospiraceae bacterium]
MHLLTSLLLQFAIAGAILTALTLWAKQQKNILWTFLQHFVGVWFMFSGAVKAVDPIGTAYKMQDYFESFEQTFSGLNNMFNGLAPLFPYLARYANGFSITMITIELVLGLALILGWRPRLTTWLLFLVMVFFTFLTGFTYLTGYVPSEANFFDFAQWGPYVKTQMRVTDCGCFGDFLKLDPRVSFYKDLGLMIPTLLFLFRPSWMHQLWTARTRDLTIGIATAGSLLFCIQNTYWNLPMVDFRPFKVGTNLRERKEVEGSAKTDILGWVLENKTTGEVVTYTEPEPNKYTYLQKYPKDQGWSVKDQIQTDMYVLVDGQRQPITKTKISDFAVEDGENGEVTDDLLAEPGYSLMILAYHLEGIQQPETVVVQDTVWTNDTIRVNADSFRTERLMASLEPRKVERMTFLPTVGYDQVFRNGINPLADAAMAAGWKVYAITTYADNEFAADFKEKVGAKYPFYKADDKLLKTIIRANPGVVVLKDGQVLAMYHQRHLPTFDQIRK